MRKLQRERAGRVLCSNVSTLLEMLVMATMITSRKFNQDASGAKRAASDGPVFITSRGHAAHVLMTIEECRRLKGDAAAPRKLADALAFEGDPDIEFELPKRRLELGRPLHLD